VTIMGLMMLSGQTRKTMNQKQRRKARCQWFDTAGGWARAFAHYFLYTILK